MLRSFPSPWPEPLARALESLQREKVQLVSQGAQCYDLSMINPDLPPPRLLLDKLVEASFKPERHRYAIARGIRRIRAAFAAKYQRAFNVVVDPETEVCCTTGTKEAVINLLSAVIPRGARILVGAPTYPVFLAAANVSAHTVETFSLREDWEEMAHDIGQKVRSKKIDCLLLSFPNNPTGITVPRSFYDSLGDLLQGTECFVVNDFAYGEMTHERVSALGSPSLQGRVVETFSMSKAYNVPGWRIGALLGARRIVEAFTQRKQWMDYGTFLPLQDAASAALEDAQDFVQPTSREYDRRARTFITSLPVLDEERWKHTSGLPFVWHRPVVSGSPLNSLALCRAILSRGHVAISPGIMFGPEGEGWIRIALVQDEPSLIDARARIAQIMGALRENIPLCETVSMPSFY